MLKNFYTIKSKHIDGTTAKYTLSFNGEHPVYAAHFPNNPITPGVCLIQICKELTEKMLCKPLFLQTVKNVKFLKIITPNEIENIDVSLSVIQSELEYKVSAVISGLEECVFTKLSLVLQPANRQINE
jgi:3-hydroxyacyl-[acyl-carrier-protein] dehydratase